MGNLFNIVNVAGWTTLLALLHYKFSSDPLHFPQEDLHLEVTILKAVQCFQIMDIILILIGYSKGSIFGSIAQITGRLVVALYFVEEGTDRYSFLLMATMWAIADITRYLHYLVKSATTTFFRYNLFIVLYPVGVFGEMRVINDYIKRHISDLSLEAINIIRIVQVAIVIGMLFLYAYMFRMRSKNYKGLKSLKGEKKGTTEEKPSGKTSKSVKRE